jgi:prepilin-type N-terminal cleavage/methylation domain-containing protein
MLRDVKGYTLIELIVVMILIGLIFSITAPRFQDAVLTDKLKSTTRNLIGKINELRTEAVQKQEAQVLCFDLESNLYWNGPGNMTQEERDSYREKRATYLPQGVRISDISFSDKEKKIAGGEVDLQFNKKGYVQQSAIHLESEDGREFTIVLRPFLPGVKVFEKYFEFEDL